MTMPDEPLSRVDEPISEQTAQYLLHVMRHCEVPVGEALRLLVGWGYSLVFKTLAVDNDELNLRYGGTLVKATILDHRRQPIEPAPVVWMTPRSSSQAHGFRQAEVAARQPMMHTLCREEGPYPVKKLRRDDFGLRCAACVDAVLRGVPYGSQATP